MAMKQHSIRTEAMPLLIYNLKWFYSLLSLVTIVS